MVGKNIKKFREQKGLTQDALAEKLNVTRQALSNWERGKTQPDIETLQKISEILEVSVEELIYGHRTDQKSTNIVITNGHISDGAKKGVTFGAVLAVVISYVKWQSIGWAIFHGLLNWFYVIYYIIKYGWS